MSSEEAQMNAYLQWLESQHAQANMNMQDNEEDDDDHPYNQRHDDDEGHPPSHYDDDVQAPLVHPRSLASRPQDKNQAWALVH